MKHRLPDNSTNLAQVRAFAEEVRMQVAAMTLRGLRARYTTIWSREWPFPDTYLAELWSECRVVHNAVTARVPPPAVYDLCLELMRECHDFQPGPSAPTEEPT